MDIHTLNAAKNYAALKDVTKPSATDGNVAITMAKDFAQTLAQGENAALQATQGSIDPHTLVQALAQSELAVETAITVRNKVVEAYQEILRMPV